MLSEDLQQELARLSDTDSLRTLRTVQSAVGPRVQVDGRWYVLMCSNNYLNLAADPRVIAAAQHGAETWGVGTGASALVCGHGTPHAELERSLSGWLGFESALITPSGYAANHAVLTALAGPPDLICLDKLVHASLIDAAGASGATVRVFPHCNYDKLERLLQRAHQPGEPGQGYRRRFIVTDSVFSMDGDLADLAALVEIKRKYDAVLVVDEAHGLGVFGGTGGGLCEQTQTTAGVDVYVANLAKAVGACGGFVAASRPIIETLVNRARAFIFSTALSPMIVAAAREAVRIIQTEPQRRIRLLTLAKQFRDGLAALGLSTPSQSQIVPVIYGENAAALKASAKLAEAGYWVPAIRPPTVAPGTARLRISLNCDHTPADILGVLGVLANHLPGRFHHENTKARK